MGIRPVDLQVMVQRAPEINRATNSDGSRAETQNSQFAQSFQKVVEQESKQVANTQQSEKSDVDKDGRGRGGGGGKDDRDKRSGQEKEEGKGGLNRGLLDVKI